MIKKIPIILLIGAGRFGISHLRVLLAFEKQGKIHLKGVVVKTKQSQQQIKREFGVETYTKLINKLLKNTDAVDIVTPSSTHFSIAAKCLKYTNVFVEKPLALNSRQGIKLVKLARDSQKILVVGHIFRFNKVVQKLCEIVRKNFEKLYFIEGEYTSLSEPNNDCGAIITYLHHFDILDYILGKQPNSVYAQVANPIRKKSTFEDEAKVLLNYENFSAFLHLGWVGLEKKRTLNLFFTDCEIYCNLAKQSIVIHKQNERPKTLNFKTEEPLQLELKNFINVLKFKKPVYPDGEIGLEILKIVDKVYQSVKTNRVISLKG